MRHFSQSHDSRRRLFLTAKKEAEYRTYVDRNAITRRTGVDYGRDNFAYDPVKVADWEMPDGLAGRLPVVLVRAVEEWIHAGAAIETAMERLQRLDEDAIHRAYPRLTHDHLVSSRRLVQHTPLDAGPEVAPLSPPMTSSPAPECDGASDDKRKAMLIRAMQQLPADITGAVGMESPPFTPVCSSTVSSGSRSPAMSGSRSPAMSAMGAHDSCPDMSDLTAQLTLSSAAGVAARYSPPHPDELAWTSFQNEYNAELVELRQHAVQRLKGAGRLVNMELLELESDHTAAAALAEFQAWWSSMQDRVRQVQQTVEQQQAPRLDVVIMIMQLQSRPPVLGATMFSS